MFRTTSGVLLSEREEGIPHGQSVRLFQVLNDYSALSYEAVIYFDTEPSYKMTDTQVAVRYRQRFYRDWLVLELKPKVTFPEENDHDVNLGITIQLEASFGKSSHTGGEYQKIFQ